VVATRNETYLDKSQFYFNALMACVAMCRPYV